MVAGILPMILAASLFGACGGGDDDGGSSSGGTGSDAKFVADICKAGAKFAKAMDGLEKELGNETDFSKIAEKAAKPFEDFQKDFAKANPPKDLVEWHDSTSDALKAAVKGLKDGNFDALGSDLITEPPAEAADRLSKAADGNKDCADADIAFGN